MGTSPLNKRSERLERKINSPIRINNGIAESSQLLLARYRIREKIRPIRSASKSPSSQSEPMETASIEAKIQVPIDRKNSSREATPTATQKISMIATLSVCGYGAFAK